MTDREWALLASDIANPDTWAVWSDMVAKRDEEDEALLAYRSGGPGDAISRMASSGPEVISVGVHLWMVNECAVITYSLDTYGFRHEVHFRHGPISRLERYSVNPATALVMMRVDEMFAGASIGKTMTTAQRLLSEAEAIYRHSTGADCRGVEMTRRSSTAAKQRTYPIRGTRNPMRRGDKGKHGRARR